MTNDLHAAGIRTTKIAAIAALVLASLLIATPTSARAERGTRTQLLAEGIGMKAHPSVRVRSFQRVLQRRGYDLGPAGVDGRFGPDTAAAVRRFQRRHGMAINGIVGPATRRAMKLGATRRGEHAARHSKRRAGGHRLPAPDATTARRPGSTPSTASPSTTGSRRPAIPPTAGQQSTSDTNNPATPVAPPTGASQPDGGGTRVTNDDHVSRSGVFLAIGAVAAILLALAAPLLREDPRAPRGRATTKTGGRTRSVRPTRPSASANGKAPAPDPAARSRTVAAAAAGTTNGSRRPAASGDAAGPLAPGDTVLGYVAVANGGRAASIRAIREACGRAGWSLADVVCDRPNGHGGQHPEITAVLARIADGEIGGLVVGQGDDALFSTIEGGGVDVPSTAEQGFVVHRLGEDSDCCDVALITLDGRRSSGGRAVR